VKPVPFSLLCNYVSRLEESGLNDNTQLIIIIIIITLYNYYIGKPQFIHNNTEQMITVKHSLFSHFVQVINIIHSLVGILNYSPDY